MFSIIYPVIIKESRKSEIKLQIALEIFEMSSFWIPFRSESSSLIFEVISKGSEFIIESIFGFLKDLSKYFPKSSEIKAGTNWNQILNNSYLLRRSFGLVKKTPEDCDSEIFTLKGLSLAKKSAQFDIFFDIKVNLNYYFAFFPQFCMKNYWFTQKI